MRNLQFRAEQLARAQQKRRIERLKQSLRDSAPELAVTSEGDQVAIEGRGLLRRWLADPTLRWLGMMSR